MKNLCRGVVAALALSTVVAAPAGSASAQQKDVAPSAGAAASVTGDAYLGLGVPEIRKRIRQANATPMSARDRECRAAVTARMPKWWGPSGHTVVCKPGTTKGYDFWFDGVAVLTVNSKLEPEQWVQAAPWAASKVARTERLPLKSAPKLCRQAVRGFSSLSRKTGGYRILCVPTINTKVPGVNVKDMSILGYVRYSTKTIAILETRDVAQMQLVTAHELGHAVSYMPKAGGLRTAVTRQTKRSTFTSGPYIGMPAEVWAESFARYWTRQYKAPSVQPGRLSVKRVDALLRRYGLPRR